VGGTKEGIGILFGVVTRRLVSLFKARYGNLFNKACRSIFDILPYLSCHDIVRLRNRWRPVIF